MSVTTTQNQLTYDSRLLLADYELHHSGDAPDEPTTAQLSQHPVPEHEAPPGWDHSHRRVPPYRPVNRHLDQSQRRVYQNGAEHAFLVVMFTGVGLQASLAQAWRATGGKLNESYFRYKIGGEW